MTADEDIPAVFPAPPEPPDELGWWAADPEPCQACGDSTWWRDHNGVAYCAGGHR